MLTLAVKPQWVRCKLDETIEQSCSDFLAHTLEVCKTVITTVLMVMSGMDPHMICGNTGMGNGHVLVGLCRSGCY
jgi:hypothetical protein